MKFKTDIYISPSSSVIETFYSDFDNNYNRHAISYSSEDLSLLANILTNSNHLTFKKDIYIPGILMIGTDFIVFERPPCKKVISYIPKQLHEIESSDKQFYFEINIPWQVYVAYYNYSYTEDSPTHILNNVYMYFRNSPMSSIDDYVYVPPLPNFYSNSLLCRPFYDNIRDLQADDEDTINNIIKTAHQWIWSSNNNLDLTSSIVDYSRYFDMTSEIKVSNTFFDYNVDPFQYNVHSYYSSATHLLSLMRTWEALSPSQVLSLDWVPPINEKFFHREIHSYLEQYLYDYFVYIDYFGDIVVDREDFVFEEYIDGYDLSEFVRLYASDMIAPKSLKTVLSSHLSFSEYDFPRSYLTEISQFSNYLSSKSS